MVKAVNRIRVSTSAVYGIATKCGLISRNGGADTDMELVIRAVLSMTTIVNP